MKTIYVDLQVSTLDMPIEAAAMLIVGKYPMIDLRELHMAHCMALMRTDFRYYEPLLKWIPSEIQVEARFKVGDIVTYEPKLYKPQRWWARVHKVEPGVDWQRLTIRSQDQIPDSSWVQSWPAHREITVGSVECTLRRRTR